MNIGIVSYYAVTNIGDKILTDTVKWLLSNHTTEIIDINARYIYRYKGVLGRIERIIQKHFINRTTEEDIAKFFRKKLKNKDLIIFAGGQIIDFKYTDCCRNIYLLVKTAERLGIPIAFHAIGMAGNNYSDYRVNTVKMIFSSPAIRSVSVRERHEEFIKNFAVPSINKVEKVIDTAIWCNECYSIKKASHFPYKTIGINVINHKVLDNYYGITSNNQIIDLYILIYNRFTEQGLNVYFFTNGVQHDETTLTQIIRSIKNGEEKVLRPKVHGSGKEFVQMLTKFDFIISSRLHTSICCYSLEIPTIALPWDCKFIDFYTDTQQLDRCYTLSNLEEDLFIKQIEDCIHKPYTSHKYNSYRNAVKNSLLNVVSNFDKR